MKKIIGQTVLVAGILVLFLQQAIASDPGFIQNMPQLTQDPDRPGAMIWQKPGLNRAAYNKVMIEPITVFISPTSEYQGMNADELKAVSDRFLATITKTLAPEIQVVDKAGPGVMYVRAALTDVDVAKKKRGILGYTPIGFLVKAVHDESVGPSLSVKNASLEIEMLDSVSGDRLGVLVDKAPKSADTETLSWDSINNSFTFYAERFKARMQQAK